jgi:hypothetical protein
VQVVFAYRGVDPFVLDSDLLRGAVFQQAQGRPSEHSEVGGTVAPPDSRLVFRKAYIQLPMKPVLDRPMTAYRLSEAIGRKSLAEDLIRDLDMVLSDAIHIADRDPDRLEILPAIRIGQVLR